MESNIIQNESAETAAAGEACPSPAPVEHAPSRSELARMALVAVALRAVVLALDAQPRFFLGDSESYLGTAFGQWIPPDRSWLYGLIVNALLRVTHHFVALIAVQAAFSAALCVGIAALLRALGVRPWLAWAALLLQSADPLLHYYDRSVMTDAPGSAAIWLGIAFTSVALCRDARSSWRAAAFCLVAATCLRTALLPLVLLVPGYALAVRGGSVLRAWRREVGVPWRVRLHPLVGSAWLGFGTAIGLLVYAVITGRVVESRPALNPKTGYFLVGLVAPILAPEDFHGLGLKDPATLLRETHHEESSLRNWQIFGEQGLAPRMERELGDWRRTSEAGRILARRSIQRDPLGFARLTLACAREYLTLDANQAGFDSGFGLDRPLPHGLVASLHAKVRDEIDPQVVARPSLVLAALYPWSHALPLLGWLALFFPVVVWLAPGRRTAASRVVVPLLLACCWTYALFLFAFSAGYSQRYLLPFTPLLLALLGLWVEGWLQPRHEAGHAGGGGDR